MAVGLSDGTTYNDETEWLASADHRTDKQRSDQSEINSNTTSGDFRSRFGGAEERPLVYIGRPPQSPTEPAGAFNSTPGTEAPGNLSNISFLKAGQVLNAGVDATIGAVSHLPETLQNLPESIARTFALPGDVLSGKVQPGSIQEIERAADLAGLMVTGPAPVASKMADGTLGSFAGIRSATIDKGVLAHAQEMEMVQAAHPDDIWGQTGFFRGADNRWRYEIDDSTSKLKPEAFDSIITPGKPGGTMQGVEGWDVIKGTEDLHTVSLKGIAPPVLKDNASIKELSDWFRAKKAFNEQSNLHLPDVLDHPELFKAYPELKTMRVEPLPDSIQKNTNIMGHMSEDGPAGTLRLKDNLHPEYAKSIIMHEVQHRIQRIEGFATGGDARQFLPKELEPAEEGFKKARDEVIPAIKEKGYSDKEINTIKWASQLEPETMEILKKNSDPTLKLLDRAKEDGVYNSLSNIAKSENLLKQAKEEAFDKYQRLMGEVEARNVQNRLNYDKFRRAFSPPDRTEGMPRSQQIEQGSGTSNSEVTPMRNPANDNELGRIKQVAEDAKRMREEIQKAHDDHFGLSYIANMKTLDNKHTEIKKVLDSIHRKGYNEFDQARLIKLQKEYDGLWTRRND